MKEVLKRSDLTGVEFFLEAVFIHDHDVFNLIADHLLQGLGILQGFVVQLPLGRVLPKEGFACAEVVNEVDGQSNRPAECLREEIFGTAIRPAIDLDRPGSLVFTARGKFEIVDGLGFSFPSLNLGFCAEHAKRAALCAEELLDGIPHITREVSEFRPDFSEHP